MAQVHKQDAQHIWYRLLDLVIYALPPGLPLVVMMMGSVARQRPKDIGLMLINPSILKLGAAIDIVCFDKTGTLTASAVFANDRSLQVRQSRCCKHLAFAGTCNACLLYHHKSKLSALYGAGSLAWCVASAPSSLHIAAAERFALEQQAEAGVCRVPQPEHGQQVCSGRSGHGACLVQSCGGPLPGTCHLSHLHHRD